MEIKTDFQKKTIFLPIVGHAIFSCFFASFHEKVFSIEILTSAPKRNFSSFRLLSRKFIFFFQQIFLSNRLCVSKRQLASWYRPQIDRQTAGLAVIDRQTAGLAEIDRQTAGWHGQVDRQLVCQRDRWIQAIDPGVRGKAVACRFKWPGGGGGQGI